MTYSYGDGLADPEYEYCAFDNWVYDGREYTSAALASAWDEALANGQTEAISVEAHFTRLRYKISLYSMTVAGADPTDDELAGASPIGRSANRYLGYGTSLSCPSTLDGKNFWYWMVGKQGETDITKYEKLTSLKSIFFPTEGDRDPANASYVAIACFGNGDAPPETEQVSFRVVNVTKEKVGNTWRAVVTVTVDGPANEYTIEKMGVHHLTADKAYDQEGNEKSGYVTVKDEETGKNQELAKDQMKNLLSTLDGFVFEPSALDRVNKKGELGFTYTFRTPITEEYPDFYANAYITYTYGGETVTKTVSMSTDGYDSISIR
jgi:hypothetical protein